MVDSDSDHISAQGRLHGAKQVQRVVLCVCPDRMLSGFAQTVKNLCHSETNPTSTPLNWSPFNNLLGYVCGIFIYIHVSYFNDTAKNFPLFQVNYARRKTHYRKELLFCVFQALY